MFFQTTSFSDDNRDNGDNRRNGRNARMSRGDMQRIQRRMLLLSWFLRSLLLSENIFLVVAVVFAVI